MGLSIVLIGYLLLTILKTNLIGRMAAVYLIACTNAAVIPFLAYRLECLTNKSSTSISISSSGTIALANIAGITTPFLFNTDDIYYKKGSITLVCFFGFCILATLFLWFKFGGKIKDSDDIEFEIINDNRKEKKVTVV